ncbi:MAG: hypothetical protein AAF846_10130 [Chloroflexota bacterium]
MTRQMRHKVLYQNEKHELLGDSSGQLYFPTLFGIATLGTKPTFAIRNRKIYLNTIDMISRGLSDNFPSINGVKPTIKDDFYLCYEDIDQLLPISSIAFICKDIALDEYHSAPHLAISDFVVCLRLTIEDGTVMQVDDLSELCEAIRDREKSLTEDKFNIAREQGISVIKLFTEIDDNDELRSLRHQVGIISNETYF